MNQDFVTQVINSWDPIDLLAISPDDEYEVEIFLVDQAMKETDNVNDLAEKIHKIFTEAFSNAIFHKTFADCLAVAEQLLNNQQVKNTYNKSEGIDGFSILGKNDGERGKHITVIDKDVQVRILTESEIEAVLQQKVSASLATYDLAVFPRITRLYFLWEEGVLYLTSLAWKPYLQDIKRNAEVEVSVDTREQISQNKQEYSQIVIRGFARIEKPEDEKWHRKILCKYLDTQLVDQIINPKVPYVLVLINPKNMKGINVWPS